jgi:hypothetical protein
MCLSLSGRREAHPLKKEIETDFVIPVSLCCQGCRAPRPLNGIDSGGLKRTHLSRQNLPPPQHKERTDGPSAIRNPANDFLTILQPARRHDLGVRAAFRKSSEKRLRRCGVMPDPGSSPNVLQCVQGTTSSSSPTPANPGDPTQWFIHVSRQKFRSGWGWRPARQIRTCRNLEHLPMPAATAPMSAFQDRVF